MLSSRVPADLRRDPRRRRSTPADGRAMSAPLPYDVDADEGGARRRSPTDDDGWAYEIKWDGMRALAFVDDGLSMRSTRRLELADRFPELAGLADHLAGHRVALDGEVVAFDGDDRSDFALPPTADARRRPVRGDPPIGHRAGGVRGVRSAAPRRDRHHAAALRRTPPAAAASWWSRARRGTCPPTRSAPARPLRRGDRTGARRAWWPSGSTAATSRAGVRRRGARSRCGASRSSWSVAGPPARATGRVASARCCSATTGPSTTSARRPESPLVYAGHVGTGFSGGELDRLEAQLDNLASATSPFEPPLPRPSPGRPLGRTRARGPGRLRRVDTRWAAPSPLVPRPGIGQTGRARSPVRPAEPRGPVCRARMRTFVAERDRVPPISGRSSGVEK